MGLSESPWKWCRFLLLLYSSALNVAIFSWLLHGAHSLSSLLSIFAIRISFFFRSEAEKQQQQQWQYNCRRVPKGSRKRGQQRSIRTRTRHYEGLRDWGTKKGKREWWRKTKNVYDYSTRKEGKAPAQNAPTRVTFDYSADYCRAGFDERCRRRTFSR